MDEESDFEEHVSIAPTGLPHSQQVGIIIIEKSPCQLISLKESSLSLSSTDNSVDLLRFKV